MIIAKIVNGKVTNLSGRRSSGKSISAILSNPSEIFFNNKGEKITIVCKNGKLSQAMKYSPYGDLLYVKKYIWDGDNHTTEILKPDDDGRFEITEILKRTKETITRYIDNNKTIDKYYRKFAQGWKRLDNEICKEKASFFNPINIYLQSGQMINRFLRSGKFYNDKFRNNSFPDINEVPERFRDYVYYEIKKAKALNRKIIDAIPHIDKMTYSSKTSKPMVVYRDAPVKWLESAKDEKLIDRGYCATSLEPGASLEGMISKEPTMRYIIELPEGTPYFDLTYTSEKEMVLPRNSEFLDLGNGRLRYLGQIKE